MNYLGHAYLSLDNSEVLTGNMIGDYVKGRLAMKNYPDGIRKGILLHRKIDEFTDHHHATIRAKVFFKADYGLYAGAIMDTLFDHFLANDSGIFPSEHTLQLFSKHTYSQLSVYKDYFPTAFKAYFPIMLEHDWLTGYRKVKGMERALKGLERRAKYIPHIDKAFEIFISHYYELNQRYTEMINDLVNFVKIEINV